MNPHSSIKTKCALLANQPNFLQRLAVKSSAVSFHCKPDSSVYVRQMDFSGSHLFHENP